MSATLNLPLITFTFKDTADAKCQSISPIIPRTAITLYSIPSNSTATNNSANIKGINIIGSASKYFFHIFLSFLFKNTYYNTFMIYLLLIHSKSE